MARESFLKTAALSTALIVSPFAAPVYAQEQETEELALLEEVCTTEGSVTENGESMNGRRIMLALLNYVNPSQSAGEDFFAAIGHCTEEDILAARRTLHSPNSLLEPDTVQVIDEFLLSVLRVFRSGSEQTAESTI